LRDGGRDEVTGREVDDVAFGGRQVHLAVDLRGLPRVATHQHGGVLVARALDEHLKLSTEYRAAVASRRTAAERHKRA